VRALAELNSDRESSRDHWIVAARRSSPLVIGLGEGENFLGSDVAAFVAFTSRAAEVDDDQVLVLSADAVRVWDKDGNAVEPRTWEVTWDASAAVKGGYATFMDKEIHEQPAAVADTLRGRVDGAGAIVLDEMRIEPTILRSIDKIIVVACGTAAYAGHVAKYAIEHWCRIPVEIELAHEFRYRDPIVSEKTLTVAISQSGETMDTIQAVRHAREQGSRVLAIVNTYGSTIAREADAVLYTHAGPEVAVASTKAFLAQITACYLLGLYLAQLRGNKWPDEVADYLDKLGRMPAKIQRLIDGQERAVRALGAELSDRASFLFLGRHVGYPVALEGALKLKELAYVHAEGFAAGELKHGPIALVEDGLPVFIIVPTPRRPVLHDKVISNIQEVRARGDIIQKLNEEHIRPTAMIDISDGLSSELMHICKQSHCGCRVYEKAIPIDYQTAVTAEQFNMNLTTCALNGGEDYELLFTVPIGDHEKIKNIGGIRQIGYITKENLGCMLVTRDNNEFELQAQGWNPLRDE